MIRRRLPDALIIALLFVLPLVMFWQQTLGGRTLLPTENLYQYEPYATYREVVKAPAIPHNALLSDLVLQNMQWKEFIRQSIAAREIPLWNPHQFAGIPFLAAGQQSALYPFSLLYYILPLTAAYGWFTVVQLWLAGVLMFLFLRGLGVGRFGGLIGSLVYQLNGFFIAHAVFPMIVGAAVWLPLLLMMIEFIIRQKPLFGRPSSVPWVIIGAAALGCNVLAGHVEITYYTLLIAAYYAAGRLLWEIRHPHPLTPSPLHREGEKGGIRRAVFLHVIKRAGWLLAMVALGLGLGAVQFIPLFEFASLNYRDGRTTLEQVLGWAHPLRDVVQFALPNFYGNPSHHSYFDVFTGQTVPATVNALGQSISTIDWGIKNYVEGALYLGILPLALAAFALVEAWTSRKNLPPASPEFGEENRNNGDPPSPNSGGGGVAPYRLMFALLALAGLTFMFGLPTYAVLHYGLPGFNQLHSPFRWIFAVTFSVAVLAGFGAEVLVALTPAKSGVGEGLRPSPTDHPIRRWSRRFGWALIAVGGLALLALLLSRLFYPQIEPVIDRLFQSLAGATNAYADARMFYSYQFTNVLTFGVMTLGAGVVFLLTAKPLPLTPYTERGGNTSSKPFSKWRGVWGEVKIWQIVAVGLIALDLMIASWNFNPASDPALLDFTPPAIQWLQQQQSEGPFRYITLDDPTMPPLFNANMTWRYGLDDARGYESIIPKQYVDFMQQLAPQTQLDYNRIAPLYTAYPAELNFDVADALRSPLLGMLNVRYVITHKTTTLPGGLTYSREPHRYPPAYALVYEDEAVRIWEHGYAPRAGIMVVDKGQRPQLDVYYGLMPVTWDSDTGREKVVHADLNSDLDSWLIVSETYLPGWRAFVRPRGGGDDSERPFEIERVFDNFQGVNLSPDVLQAAFQPVYESLPEAQQTALDNRQVTVRLVYSPASFQVGLFGSFISGVVLVFMAGVWAWRLVVRPDAKASGAAVVAKNSLAPIILNLFNRGIDFGFAFVMLRILGPEGAGIYYYAAFIFGWFDILTNFGLNVFLTRDVARDRSRAWRLLYNTSALRLALMLAGVALLAGFLAARQSLPGSDPLTSEAVIAIVLLYIGLLPNSLSTGLSALFYAFEKAEVPAAITTVATINKAAFGVLALALGFGVIGLAGVSIITNAVTLVVLAWSARGIVALTPRPPLPEGEGEKIQSLHDAGVGAHGGAPLPDHRTYKPDIKLMRGMIGQSWPLMLNHFLATIFFQVDVVIIEAIHGARMVGQYSVAYKWVAALNVIPAFFTMALLPVMSRQAHEDRAALRRNYRLAIKLLVSTALPLAVVFTFMAYILTGILGGAEYLPDGAIATQLMIWSIPIGWMNSLTQYVLIALDLQRRITWAFFIAVTFNIVANLIFIPEYGYRAAALATIASEAVLLIPFALLLRGAMGSVGWLGIVAKPLAATAVMVAVFLIGWDAQPALTLVIGGLVYPAALLALRPLDADEWARLLPLLPGRLRRVFRFQWAASR